VEKSLAKGQAAKSWRDTFAQTIEQHRNAAQAAEIEELYRQGLGLPLFDYAAGR
jgi:tRNA A-37 threonylcarbamoyl transferase component Bud32